jgi:hypothetical protein
MDLQANVKAWSGNISPRIEKFESVPSVSKVMLIPILKHYQDCGQMVSGVWCCAVFEEELKPAIHRNCRGMLTNGGVLYHDNARSHVGAAITEFPPT